MEIDRDVLVAMRDGVRLATDIYRPKNAAGKCPVIMERTPYDKTQCGSIEQSFGDKEPASREELAAYFCSLGYAVVFQDCRGCYLSEGTFEKYLQEAHDGYDAIEWAAGQPWCDGRVGTFGFSYSAHAELAAACMSPPSLKAMVVHSGGFFDATGAGIRQSGALDLKQLIWAFREAVTNPAMIPDAIVRAGFEQETVEEWLKRMPIKRGHSPLSVAPQLEKMFFEQWVNDPGSEYWNHPSTQVRKFFDNIPDIPALCIGGWYDNSIWNVENLYRAFSKKHPDSEFVVGIWTHGNHHTDTAGEICFGSLAAMGGGEIPDYLNLRGRFFQKTIPTESSKAGDAKDAPPVRVFVMGGGTGRKTKARGPNHGGGWCSLSQWPPVGIETVPYYLHADGGLSREAARHDEKALSYEFDPEHPVPTIGGAINACEPVMYGGGFDQREGESFYGSSEPYLPLASRRDVLVFQSEPLAEPIRIIGAIKVFLHVSSDCEDTDFTAKLIDVYPSNEDFPAGYALNISDGILRARYRSKSSTPKPLVVNEITPIEINLFPTANTFAAGHRIRIDISSSNFPHFDVNPNIYDALGSSQIKKKAINSIWIGLECSSRVEMNIIKK